MRHSPSHWVGTQVVPGETAAPVKLNGSPRTSPPSSSISCPRRVCHIVPGSRNRLSRPPRRSRSQRARKTAVWGVQRRRQFASLLNTTLLVVGGGGGGR